MTGGQLPLPIGNEHPHLRLARQLPAGERHRRPSPRMHDTVYSDHPQHARGLRASLDQLRAIHASRAPVFDIDPESVVVFHCNRLPEESFLRAADLQVLDRYPDRLVVAASNDEELIALRLRLERYESSAGRADSGADELEPEQVPHDGLPKNATYESLFDCIDSIEEYGIEERLAPSVKDVLQTGNMADLISVDIQCWCPEEDSDARRRNDLVRRAVIAAGGTVEDFTVRPSVGLSLVRADLTHAVAHILARVDHVRRIDLLPRPHLGYRDLANWVPQTLPLTLTPLADAPVVALIDSGVRSGHGLIGPAVAFESYSPALSGPTDENGHGTFVASLILHGSLEDRLGEASLRPAAKLVSIRVLDASGDFPASSLWETELLAALELAHEQGARVVNLSIGDPRRPYSPPRATPLAAAVDEFIRRTGVVVIISAGNMRPADYSNDVGPEDYLEDLLTSPASGLLDPASSALALTVGGLGADPGQGHRPARPRIDVVPVSSPDWPSPVSRVGPGANGMIKPDLVAPSGGYGYDTGTRRFVSDSSVQVIGANALPPDRPLAADAGTSYAAPLVTHAAAKALAANPDISGNALRALLLVSSQSTKAVHAEPRKEVGRVAQQRFTGYGRPDATRASVSTDHRAVLLAEASIPCNGVHLYRVQLPSSFFESGGWRELVVSLAFDPMSRSTRLDYLASRMAFTVYKGISLDEVADAYINFTPDAGAPVPETPPEGVEPAEDESDEMAPPGIVSHRISMHPSNRARSRGANQVASHKFWHKLPDTKGLDLILAVKHVNNWGPEDSQQTYAMAVSLERDENHSTIYNDLRVTVEQVVDISAQVEV